MNLLIIGTGYVGLVTGACFAEIGHQVTCLDIDQNKITTLSQGQIPFYEPHLKDLVAKHRKNHKLVFSADYEDCVPKADVIFLAVPTPAKADGSCDLRFFIQAAKTLAQHIHKYTVIVNKSTVPVGSAQMIQQVIEEILMSKGLDIPFDIVSNPEFLKEGSAVTDCLSPDRIILGVFSDRAEETMRKVYAPLLDNGLPLFIMDPRSAELTKYAANAMLATRISFMNELSGLCEKVGANIQHIKQGIGSDKRIGPRFLNAGIGYGGSCFPKDIKALQATAVAYGVSMPILHATEEVNQRQKQVLISMMKEYFDSKQGLRGKTIAIWGLSFKPETDDMREAPSIEIIEQLQEAGALIRAFDPISMETAKKAITCHDSITWCTDLYHACEGADALALLTEWAIFQHADPHLISATMNGRAFFDGRNIFNPLDMKQYGFHYFGIGIQNEWQMDPMELAMTTTNAR
jgi:UDPglucose 6-dehydrogenase